MFALIGFVFMIFISVFIFVGLDSVVNCWVLDLSF